MKFSQGNDWRQLDRPPLRGAAFDAGYAAALGKAIVIVHQQEHAHALKEVDAAAAAVAESPEQVVRILRYVIEDRL